MKRLYSIKANCRNINGIAEKEIRLAFRERLAILFSSGIQITLVEDRLWKEYVEKLLEKDR